MWGSPQTLGGARNGLSLRASRKHSHLEFRPCSPSETVRICVCFLFVCFVCFSLGSLFSQMYSLSKGLINSQARHISVVLSHWSLVTGCGSHREWTQCPILTMGYVVIPQGCTQPAHT